MAWSLGGFTVDAITERWQKVGGGVYLKDAGAWLMFPWSLPESFSLHFLSSTKRHLCVVFLPPWQSVPVHHVAKQARTELSETVSQNRADFIFKLCHCYFVSTQNLKTLEVFVEPVAGSIRKGVHCLCPEFNPWHHTVGVENWLLQISFTHSHICCDTYACVHIYNKSMC